MHRNHAFPANHGTPMAVDTAHQAFSVVALGTLTTGVATTVAAKELLEEGFPLTEPPVEGINLVTY